MARTHPNTDINHNKSRNEVVRDPSGTDPHSYASYWGWALGVILAAAIALAFFASEDTANAPTDSDMTVTQPAPSNIPTPAQ